jgi:hypothetical protein
LHTFGVDDHGPKAGLEVGVDAELLGFAAVSLPRVLQTILLVLERAAEKPLTIARSKFPIHVS